MYSMAGFSGYWDSLSLPPSSNTQDMREYCWDTNYSWPELCAGDGLIAGDPVQPPARPKRQRIKSMKNQVETENHRMSHIEIERNRRKQMNHYLAVLRSLMPPSYSQRGDQASIVGGAINFVKELEKLLQSLESHNQVLKQQSHTIKSNNNHPLFANFFNFPQYSTRSTRRNDLFLAGHESLMMMGLEKEESTIAAEIEVGMVESYANIKVLSRRHPKQLLKMVSWFYSLGLTILHINVTTTVDQMEMVLYSFSVKVEDNCELSTVNEIATTVHEMIKKIQEEEVMPS